MTLTVFPLYLFMVLLGVLLYFAYLLRQRNTLLKQIQKASPAVPPNPEQGHTVEESSLNRSSKPSSNTSPQNPDALQRSTAFVPPGLNFVFGEDLYDVPSNNNRLIVQSDDVYEEIESTDIDDIYEEIQPTKSANSLQNCETDENI